jgi:hypothetical protein
MALDPLPLVVLNASMQSPEAPHTIRAEIETFLKVPVTEQQVLQAFRTLEASGLVAVDSRGPHPPPNDVWFIATRAGRAAVDRDWDAVFPSKEAQGDA